jgi:hypothetical protein
MESPVWVRRCRAAIPKIVTVADIHTAVGACTFAVSFKQRFDLSIRLVLDAILQIKQNTRKSPLANNSFTLNQGLRQATRLPP